MAQSAQKCYLPDGSPDTSNNTPCDTSAQFSHCCNIADICLTNGYCFSTSQSTLYRPSCTDPLFKDASCPYFCSDVGTSAGSLLIPTNDAPPLFCCENGYDSTLKECPISTQSSHFPFTLGPAIVIYNRTSGSTDPNSTTVQTSHTTVTVYPSGSPPDNHDLSIGLGVGIPLGLLLLLTSGLLWRQKQQQKKAGIRWAKLEKSDPVPEQAAAQYDPHLGKPELGGQSMHELEEQYRTAELDSR